jgi:hypothetical protein
MYFIFSLPQIISPYLFHAFILGVTTTPFFATSHASRDLRIYLSYVLGLLLAAELWILATFDATVNSSAHDLNAVIWLHWELHSFRYTALSIVSLLHAGVVYVIETGWVVLPPSTKDRLFQLGAIEEGVGQRIRLARTARGVVMRKPEWRAKLERWWNNQRVNEPPEIPEEIKRKWEGEARDWVDGIMKIEEEKD